MFWRFVTNIRVFLVWCYCNVQCCFIVHHLLQYVKNKTRRNFVFVFPVWVFNYCIAINLKKSTNCYLFNKNIYSTTTLQISLFKRFGHHVFLKCLQHYVVFYCDSPLLSQWSKVVEVDTASSQMTVYVCTGCVASQPIHRHMFWQEPLTPLLTHKLEAYLMSG